MAIAAHQITITKPNYEFRGNFKSPEIKIVPSHDDPESSKIHYSYRRFNPPFYFSDFRVVFCTYYAILELCKFIALNMHKYHVA